MARNVRQSLYYSFIPTKLSYVLRFACVYVGLFDQHTMRHSTTCDLIAKGIRSRSVLEWKKVRQYLHIGRKTKRILKYVGKLLKVICEVVCVFVDHVGLCMDAEEKNFFEQE